MDKKYMKIAIIGAGPAGLACALECERLGVIPDLYDSEESVGWEWPSVILMMNVLEVPENGDIRRYLYKSYNLDLHPISEIRKLIFKSPNEQTTITGKPLGYFYSRGKREGSIENQLRLSIKSTAIHFNRPADYKELAKKYDYVVVATGNEVAAKELGIWEDYGVVYIQSAVAIGEFDTATQYVFFNTDYSGQGYARLTPFDPYHAVLDLYGIGIDKFDMDKKFQQFIEAEDLADLQLKIGFVLPPFSTGKVQNFQVDNILLAGRAAGLTERLTGTGCTAALGSGVLAARAMVKGKDYNSLVKPLQNHLESISSFRKLYEKLDNSGLDKMVKLTNNPIVKTPLYNSGINILGNIGSVLKKVLPKEL